MGDTREDCPACVRWLPVDTDDEPLWWICLEHREEEDEDNG